MIIHAKTTPSYFTNYKYSSFTPIITHETDSTTSSTKKLNREIV